MGNFKFLKLLFCAQLIFGSAFVNATEINKEILEHYSKPSQYLDIKISPKGTYLASTSRGEDGKIALSILNIKKQKIESITKGQGNESVNSFDWLNDKRLVLTMAREIGSLEQPIPTGELIAMDVNGKNSTILTGRRAESGDRRFSQIIDILPNEPDAVLIYSIGLTASEPYLDVYKMKVSNGRKSSKGRLPLRAYAGGGIQVFTSQEGEVIGVTAANPNENNMVSLMVKDFETNEWKEVQKSEQFGNSFRPLVFLEDNETIVGVSTLETSTNAIATLNTKTNEHKVIAVHPKVDISPIMYSEQGKAKELFGASYIYEGIEAIFFGDVENSDQQRLIASLIKSFEGHSVNLTSATSDNSMSVIRVGSANKATEFYLFDSKKRKLVKLAESRPWLKEKNIPKSKMVQYKARDGQEISAVLTLPLDKSKNLPLVLLPHGGPHGPFDTVGDIDGDAKVLAAHGYAVLQPNFRGSGGYGIDFLRAGFRNWGTVMIDDMTDGTTYLIEQGIVDKDKMCVYGGSYGGYAALQSVIREPELYKCSIGFVGVYGLDLFETVGDIPTRQTGVNYLKTVLPIGETRDLQDPVKNVDKIQVPIFIIQGEEDQRVPKDHAFALRDELEKHGKPYEWMMKAGEGHGFYKPENNVERWTKMLEFLDKHIDK